MREWVRRSTIIGKGTLDGEGKNIRGNKWNKSRLMELRLGSGLGWLDKDDKSDVESRMRAAMIIPEGHSYPALSIAIPSVVLL